jgi:hypothetical protein
MVVTILGVREPHAGMDEKTTTGETRCWKQTRQRPKGPLCPSSQRRSTSTSTIAPAQRLVDDAGSGYHPLPLCGFVDTGQKNGSAKSTGADGCLRPRILSVILRGLCAPMSAEVLDLPEGELCTSGPPRMPQSWRTTLSKERLILSASSPLYSMKPSFLNWFRKKFTRARVVPIISASVSCETFGTTRAGRSCFP